MIEYSMIQFLKNFHQGCKEYSRDKKKLTKKWTRNKMSLSDYQPDRQHRSPLFGSAQISSISPMLRSGNLTRTPKPQRMEDQRVIEFEDGQCSILDLDLLYGTEPKTDIPPFERSEKEIFKQMLIDLTDISLNEYTMHYICHTDVILGKPYNSVKTKISEELKKFYEYSVANMPFNLWIRIIDEHYQIMMNILPLTLQKTLVDLRTKFTQKYVKNKVERGLRDFERSKRKEKKEEHKVQVFSTEASDNDPTILTDDEYTEIVVSDILNTPFHEFLKNQLEGDYSQNLVFSFMAYLKNQEQEVIKAFNDCNQMNQDFYKFSNLKNRTIENYKKPRGFPLKLGDNEAYLFGFDYEISHHGLLQMKKQREKEVPKEKTKVPVKRKDYSYSEDSFFDSCEDNESQENYEGLKAIRKKTTLKQLDGKYSEFH